MKFSSTIVSIVALTSVATVMAASSSSQQEVQHRLRGGAPASSMLAKTVEERRLYVEKPGMDYRGPDDQEGGETMNMGAHPGGSEVDPEDVKEGASYLATDMNATTSTSTSTSSDTASSADCASIVDTVCAMEGVTVFCDVLTASSSTSEDADPSPSKGGAALVLRSQQLGDRRLSEDVDDALGLNDESKEFTLFVPTDAAFAKTATALEQLSEEEVGRVVMFHLYEGMMLTSDKLVCGEKIISMDDNGDASRTKCMDDNKYQNGNGNTKIGTMPKINTVDHLACNGVIHTLDDVMFPVSLSQLEAESSSSDDSSGDMSNVDASKGVLSGAVEDIYNAGTNYWNTVGDAATDYYNTVVSF